jgi:hypothetical protein
MIVVVVVVVVGTTHGAIRNPQSPTVFACATVKVRHSPPALIITFYPISASSLVDFTEHQHGSAPPV